MSDTTELTPREVGGAVLALEKMLKWRDANGESLIMAIRHCDVTATHIRSVLAALRVAHQPAPLSSVESREDEMPDRETVIGQILEVYSAAFALRREGRELGLQDRREGRRGSSRRRRSLHPAHRGGK